MSPASMADLGVTRPKDSSSKQQLDILAMDSDEQFQATPINRAGNAIPANGSDNHVNEDPTFMQNQIAIQRSPSTTKGQASALSHQLSIKSHGSRDFGAVRSGIANVLSEEGDFKQGRSDSESSIVHTTNKCSLSKSSSERSAKSVRSVHAVGSYPLGSLRLHSPSPTRPTSNAIKHECLKSGDVFIARDVPAGAIVGCDTIAFTIKPTDRFDGIREIPAGIHFIWGGSTVTSLRNGFWVISSERNPSDFGAIHVRRWDRENEILEEEVSRAEIRIQKEGLPEIFFNLRPYIKPGHGSISPSKGQSAISIRDTDIWSKLTSCISGALLSQITGCKEWNQWHVCSSNDNEQQITLSRDPKIMIDHYKDEPLNFMFPRHMRTFSEESLGSLRTEQALDSTSHVLASISSNCMNEDPDEILGEIQFCYITGMMLGNVACMEQWAHIIKTMFRAFQLVLVRPVFFRKFIESVHSQLIYDEEGVEGSILDHDPTLGDDLRLILTTFKSRLNEMLLEKGNDINESQTAVGKAFEEFESWLWRWEWDLRGNYVRSGRIQLEDGQWVDAELKDFEAEDERGEKKEKRTSRNASRASVRWTF